MRLGRLDNAWFGFIAGILMPPAKEEERSRGDQRNSSQCTDYNADDGTGAERRAV